MPDPYGTWKSPISTRLMTQNAIALSSPRFSGDAIYWLEGRPLEEGRSVLVRRDASGNVQDVSPPSISVRTRVHEYGGGSLLIQDEVAYYSHFDDQRLYRQRIRRQGNAAAVRSITPAPPTPAALRYADAVLARDGSALVCVRETHEPDGKVTNELVLVPEDGRADPCPLVGGADFYASPALDPSGSRLAWIEWNHPHMPWDESRICIGEFDARRGRVANRKTIAGGPGESVQQARWSPTGDLHFVSDRSGWWTIHRVRDDEMQPVASREADFGVPPWMFGVSTYAFLSHNRLACVAIENGRHRLATIDSSGEIEFHDTPYSSFGSLPELRSDGGSRILFVGGSYIQPRSIVLGDVDRGEFEVLRESFDLGIDESTISVPTQIEFDGWNDRPTYALFYPPRNDAVIPPDPDEERPPLVVLSHGGPTDAAGRSLNLGIQFWTSRGFAVVDVDYGGSSGYGRAYRDRLRGLWGVVDTADCIAAAHHLVERGLVDGDRLAIRGGSAGGYTTLCALTFHDVFRVGASYYGVADVEALARETHKFESRYLDGLLGPHPECAALYRERSPIHSVDRISCPIILLQGLEDRVVPPSQAEAMVEALDRRRIPHAYLPFEGEQHGFRRAESIERSLSGELYFYGRILGFEPTDAPEPVEIAHWE